MLTTIIKETIRGKSLGRTLQNLEFSRITLHGHGIDLGAKSNQSSYYRFLKADGAKITFCDMRPQSPEVLRIDLESEPIGVTDASQDFVICSNMLEHIYDYKRVVAEIARVLKPGGRLIGSTPFLFQVHPDPDDFFRYTESSLRRIFAEYSKVEIKPLTFGPFSAAATMVAPLLVFKPLVAMSYLSAIGLDTVLRKLAGGKKLRSTIEYFPLHYFFVCTK